MLLHPPRTVLDTALQKYKAGRTEPVLVGGITQLKPALRLMTDYRLVIQEVEGPEVLTSYNRWIESVQLKEGENKEVYVTFSPRFERIWLESRKRLPDYMEQEPANTGLRSQYALRLYSWAKKYVGDGTKVFRLRSSGECSAWSLSRMRRETSFTKRRCRFGRTSSNGRLASRLRKSTRRQT
jgi:Initiator Replication protein